MASLPPQLQPSPQQQQMPDMSAPHQRQPLPQHMQQLQQELLRSLIGSPMPAELTAPNVVTWPLSSGALQPAGLLAVLLLDFTAEKLFFAGGSCALMLFTRSVTDCSDNVN